MLVRLVIFISPQRSSMSFKILDSIISNDLHGCDQI